MRTILLLLLIFNNPIALTQEIGAILLGTAMNKPVFLVYSKKGIKLNEFIKKKQIAANAIHGEAEILFPQLIAYTQKSIKDSEWIKGTLLKDQLLQIKANTNTKFPNENGFINNGNWYSLENHFFKSMILGSHVVDFSYHKPTLCFNYQMPNREEVLTLPPEWEQILNHRRFIFYKKKKQKGDKNIFLSFSLSNDFKTSKNYGVVFKNEDRFDLRRENLFWFPNSTVEQITSLRQPEFSESEYAINPIGNRFVVNLSFLGKRSDVGRFEQKANAIEYRNLFFKGLFGLLAKDFYSEYKNVNSVIESLAKLSNKNYVARFKNSKNPIKEFVGKSEYNLVVKHWEPLPAEFILTALHSKAASNPTIKLEPEFAPLVQGKYIEMENQMFGLRPHRSIFGEDLKTLSPALFSDFKSNKIMVHHLNRDVFNQLPGNLMLVSHSEVNFIKSKSPGKSSKYKGVTKSKDNGIEMRITFLDNQFRKTYQDEIEAAKAYDRNAFCLFRGYAKLNFSIDEYPFKEMQENICPRVWQEFESVFSMNAEYQKYTNVRWLDALLDQMGLFSQTTTN